MVKHWAAGSALTLESSALETEQFLQGKLVHVFLGGRSWRLPCIENWPQSIALLLIDSTLLYILLGTQGGSVSAGFLVLGRHEEERVMRLTYIEKMDCLARH